MIAKHSIETGYLPDLKNIRILGNKEQHDLKRKYWRLFEFKISEEKTIKLDSGYKLSAIWKSILDYYTTANHVAKTIKKKFCMFLLP